MSFPNTFPTFARELLAARASLTLIDEIGLALRAHRRSLGLSQRAYALKRGYARVAQINAFHVRAGRMSPEEAYRLNEQYDGRKPHSLQVFLEYMGLSEDEFNQIVGQMVIPPHQPDFEHIPPAKEAWDVAQWYREDNRPKP